MRRIKTMDETYTPRFLDLLGSMSCEHGEPRGARYCPLCRSWLRQHGRRVDL